MQPSHCSSDGQVDVWQFVMSWPTATAVLFVQLAAVCWFDWRKLIIPNLVNFSLLATGLMVRKFSFAEDCRYALIRVAVVYALFLCIAKVYEKFRDRQGLGGGDIKFLGAAAVWIDAEHLPWLIFIASISGLAYALAVGMVDQTLSRTTKLPFGPHLALGLAVIWLMSLHGGH